MNFCPSCGSPQGAGASFCAACGFKIVTDDTPPITAPAPVQQGQQGHHSADGKWWWNGAQWVATQEAGTATSKPRKVKRMVRRLTVLAVIFVALTAANYLFWPEVIVRSLFVNSFGALAVVFTAWLVVLVAVRLARGSRSKIWAGAAIGVLVLEAGLSVGLNINADNKTTATLPVLQSYYAEVADAVSLGNMVAAGRAPSGVTFTAVKAQVDGVQNQLATMDVPAGLMEYARAIDDWAFSAAIDVPSGTTYAPQWADLAYQADPFQLTMTTEQANAATATAMQQIAVLTTYDQYARATKNKEGERYIGAKLDAQAYWLQAIYTSNDPNWVSAQLHFVEPINNYPVLNAAAADMSTASAKTWPRPRWASCSRNQQGFVACNIPQVLVPLAVVWKADINPSNTYATPSVDVAAAEKQFQTIAPIDGSQGQAITGAGSGQDTTNAAPPASFVSQCQAEGGVMGNPVYDRTVSRVPTSEGGWTCRTKNNRCFDLLTYSGSEYKGDGNVLNNGSGGCPEMGLKPTPLIPLSGGKPAPTSAPAPANGGSSSWDGSYTTAASTLSCHITGTTTDGQKMDVSPSSPMPTTQFTVRGNTIVGNGSLAINSAGQATQTVPLTGASGSATLTVTFVHTANSGVTFSGSVVLNASFQGSYGSGKERCTGPVSGSRN